MIREKLVLAVDIASTSASTAVVYLEDGRKKLLGEFGLDVGLTHSQRFLPMVDALLNSCELKLADFAAFAVTIGPGSFTGLRIGLATVKAWSQVTGIPIVPVNTLAAIGFANRGLMPVCAVLDAKKDEVYCGLYYGQQELWQPRALNPATLAIHIDALGRPICFAGDGALKCRAAFGKTLGDRFILANAENRLFAAPAAGFLALRQLESGKTVTADELQPFYLRLCEAEVKKGQTKNEQYDGI